MIRIAFAVLLLLHGAVHVIGFLVPWRLSTSPDFAYSTAVAWGTIDLGDGGVRLVGLAMLGVAVGFIVAAVGIWRRTSWAIPLAIACTIASLVGCLLESPAAILGAWLDVAILVGLGGWAYTARRTGSAPQLAKVARR